MRCFDPLVVQFVVFEDLKFVLFNVVFIGLTGRALLQLMSLQNSLLLLVSHF